MPYVRGGELYKIFKRKRDFKEEVIKFYSVQLILAIGYLHTRGVFDINLNLEKILLDQDGYIKIIDYQFMLDVGQESIVPLGIPEYLAVDVVN